MTMSSTVWDKGTRVSWVDGMGVERHGVVVHDHTDCRYQYDVEVMADGMPYAVSIEKCHLTAGDKAVRR
jgi:hypothetical protein